MAILVAGGAGYIGSHTCVELLNAGYEVVVVDNLYNSSEEALKRVEQITGKTVKFYEADVLDREALEKIFDAEDIDSVINFAGLKAVGESVQKQKGTPPYMSKYADVIVLHSRACPITSRVCLLTNPWPSPMIKLGRV